MGWTRWVMAMEHPGHRPPEWWTYERNMDPPEERSEQAGLLLQMGELTGEELTAVMKDWRRHFDDAQEPNFSLVLARSRHDVCTLA